MSSAALLFAALFELAGTRVIAGEAEFKGCYAKWSDTELTLGNTLIERKWSIRQGLLTPLSFLDKANKREWLRGPGRQPAPHPGGNIPAEERTTTFTSRTGQISPVEAESLVLEMNSKGAGSSFRCRLQIFPEAGGVTVSFDPGNKPQDPSQGTAGESVKTPDGLEAPKGGQEKKSRNLDAIEDLMLAPRHFRFTQVELMDQTDRRNELVHELEWMPLQDELELSGNLFGIEDPLTGDGLVFLKLAPLPHARPVKNPWDAKVNGGGKRVIFAGHGYRSVLLGYSGGRPGRIAALQDYQRCLRTFDPARDARFLSNTWGDRSADSRVSEAFLRKEIEAGSRLGVDVVQVDDGWQKGQSGNSSFGKGAWGRFYSADPEFWSPHPERFPNGLKPLVEAAAAKGMKFGLWFGPDSEKEMSHWERDADLLIGCCRKEGVQYIKIDAVDMASSGAEKNLHQFYDKILRESKGSVVFDADATAGLRPGYFGTPNVGPVFLENRYTDWQTYWPHLTLRNLWQLSAHVDPLRLRMEFLNNQRSTQLYKDDPLAPARYSPDTLFASVMFANPLGWFESSNLPDEYFEKLPPLVASWKKEREAIFSGHIIPIGSAPDGAAWTGFASVSKDRESARVVVFRELNAEAEWSVKIPLLKPGERTVSLMEGAGEAALYDSVLTVKVAEKLGYLFLRID
jgi:alpha-galactosidase